MIKIISKPYINWVAKRDGLKNIKASTFFPGIVVFIDKQAANDKVLCNHEAIHHAQMWEGWIVGHWIKYHQFDNKYGYRDNPFEREAYANQANLGYLKTRKPYAWTKYL